MSNTSEAHEAHLGPNGSTDELEPAEPLALDNVDFELKAPFQIPSLPFENNKRMVGILDGLTTALAADENDQIWEEACRLVLNEEKSFPKRGLDMGLLHTFSNPNTVKAHFDHYFPAGVFPGDVASAFRLAKESGNPKLRDVASAFELAKESGNPKLLLPLARLVYNLGRVDQAYRASALGSAQQAAHALVMAALPAEA